MEKTTARHKPSYTDDAMRAARRQVAELAAVWEEGEEEIRAG